MTDAIVRLAAHGWEATLDPVAGASLLSLRHAGADVLRPAPEMPATPRDTACFPLVPYANRIADGRFTHEGTRFALPHNDPAGPNSLHGVGWERAWRVIEASGAQVRLAYAHGGDAGWPWRFDAELVLALDAGGATMSIAARNAESAPRPMGIGVHPYFPVGPATTLTTEVGGMVLTDARLLPVREAGADHFADWSRGAEIAAAGAIDNCLTGWSGRAVLRDGARTRTLTAEGATALHLYAPVGGGFACLEPVSHLPDAINRGGMPLLAPGARATLSMRIALDE